MEILREHRAAPVGDAHELAAVLLVGAAPNAVDHAVVDGADVFAPDLAAEIDAAVAVAAFDRAVARAHGAEHARVADGHAADRPRERMDPRVAAQRREQAGVRRRPLGTEPARRQRRRGRIGGGAAREREARAAGASPWCGARQAPATATPMMATFIARRRAFHRRLRCAVSAVCRHSSEQKLRGRHPPRGGCTVRQPTCRMIRNVGAIDRFERFDHFARVSGEPRSIPLIEDSGVPLTDTLSSGVTTMNACMMPQARPSPASVLIVEDDSDVALSISEVVSCRLPHHHGAQRARSDVCAG